MADDIKSDIVVGPLTGDIQPAGAKMAAKQLASAYFSRRDVSMDADVGDGLTLAGIVSDGSFDAAGTGIRVRQAAW